VKGIYLDRRAQRKKEKNLGGFHGQKAGSVPWPWCPARQRSRQRVKGGAFELGYRRKAREQLRKKPPETVALTAKTRRPPLSRSSRIIRFEEKNRTRHHQKLEREGRKNKKKNPKRRPATVPRK